MTASCGQKGPLPPAVTTPPTVVYINPASAQSVPINSLVVIIFNEAMNSSTINASTISLSTGTTGTTVAGSVSSFSGTTAIFTPTSNLLPGTTYTVTVDSTVESAAGIAMGTPYNSIFFTGTTLFTSTITATAGQNGTISPSGAIQVDYFNGFQSFTITPDSGYYVANVLVDGVSIGSVTSYEFTLVETASHTISATFSRITGFSGSGG